MRHFVHIHGGAELPSSFPPDTAPESDAPNARLLIKGADRQIKGHVALWWRDVPLMEGEKIGAIGGFSAVDELYGPIVLGEAGAILREQGCTLAIGPMNGNTWRNYRYVDGGDERKPFLSEPVNPENFPDWWRAAGFAEFALYSSSFIPLNGTEATSPALKERLLRSGVAIRAINPERYDNELRIIHGLCLRSFSSNLLYTPPDEASFLESFGNVDPAFLLIAEKNGVPCGFVVGLADQEAAARGETPALILKAVAVDPASRGAGVGSLLVDELHRAGRAKGFTEAIHALQPENNPSLRITGRHQGRAFRNYVLFSKRL